MPVVAVCRLAYNGDAVWQMPDQLAVFQGASEAKRPMLDRDRSQLFAEESLEHLIEFRGDLSELFRCRVKFIRPILFRIQNTPTVDVVHMRIRTGEYCHLLA